MWDAEQTLPLLTDREQFEKYLRNKNPSAWVHILNSLSTLATDIPSEAVVTTTAGVLNLLAAEIEPPSTPFGPNAFVAARRLILRLISQVPIPADRENLLREAFTAADSLWGKLQLIDMFDGSEGQPSPGIVDPALIEELSATLRDEIREATADDLRAERSPLWILDWAASTSGENEALFALPANTDFACLLLKSAVHQDASRSGDSRAISITPRLDWRALNEVLGGEDEIRTVVQRCRATATDESLAEALDLTEGYLDGLRPSYGPPE